MYDILLVDDNQGDIRIVQEALKHTTFANKFALNVVTNGIDAIHYLKAQGEFKNSKRPHIIFLDLNLPPTSGHAVLSEIKQDPKLKAIPVIILTTSEAKNEIKQSYELNANCYIVKPVGFSAYVKFFSAFTEFATTLLRLPPH